MARRLILERSVVQANFHEVDFWPLIKAVRVRYTALCYALFWSCIAFPVALVLGYGLTSRDVPGTSVFAVHVNPRMVIVYVACYGLGWLAALPHIGWLATLERRDPTDRVGFVLRSVKIGLAYGLVQAAAVWLFAWRRTGQFVHLWPMALTVYIVAIVCGYIVGRIEAKIVPIEA